MTATPKPKNFLGRLGDYALEQLAANAPALINAGLALTNGVINRLPIPPQGKGLIKGVVGAVGTVALRDAVTPARADTSAVQRAVQRVQAGRRG
jgi:hypothetical protein